MNNISYAQMEEQDDRGRDEEAEWETKLMEAEIDHFSPTPHGTD